MAAYQNKLNSNNNNMLLTTSKPTSIHTKSSNGLVVIGVVAIKTINTLLHSVL